MEAEESATVADIMEDLSDYGENRRVFVESNDGNLFEVGAVRSYDNWRGESIVIIEIGEKA